MPQLEIADFAPQLVWLVLTFGVLYALMARVALPRIAEVLDSRERRRADDLERAESLKAEAEGALAEFERVQAATQARALAIAAETRATLAARQAERLKELEGRLAERFAESEAEITKATDKAMSGLADLSAELAQAATDRLIGADVGKQAARGAVDAELKSRA